MGFLGSIGRAFTGVAKTVGKTITSPAKLTTAVLTGGASLVAPKVFQPVTSAVQTTLFNPNLAVSLLGRSQISALPSLQGGSPMALNIGGLLGQVGNIFGGGQNPIFQGVSNVANLASQFFPQATGRPIGAPTTLQAFPAMAAAGPIMRGMATVGRSFFNRFPNLATAIQGYRNVGQKVTRANLYSLLKRFGPELLISGGILTAAAVSELMIAGPGRRRMNPGNVKALRRSLRRLESFHHLCVKVDRLRRPRSRKASGRGSAQQFVRQG
ncbi:MAG: hypothetical protein ACREU0_05895 [Burkholderiales bacterium]